MARRSETRRRHGRHRSFAREHRRTGFTQATTPVFVATGDGVISDIVVDVGSPTETWTIAFTSATEYTVTGSVSGLQTATGTTGVAYSSDSDEIAFLITAGGTAFLALADFFTLDVDNALSYIGTGDGTLTGVVADPAAPIEIWTITFTSATEYTVTGATSGLQTATGTVDVAYTSDSDEIGFIVNDGGTAFEVADEFLLDIDLVQVNTIVGDGTISNVTLDPTAAVELWTLTFTSPTTFSVSGSVSGAQAAGVTGTQYTSDGGEIGFLITVGAAAFTNIDRITFSADSAEGYQDALDPSRAVNFVVDQAARLTPNEGAAGIHDAMHLSQGDAESFSHEDVLAAAAPSDIGLT